jgi:hypothetical protein
MKDGKVNKGWRISGPASLALSRILQAKTSLPVGRGLAVDHIELRVGIHDDGIAKDLEEHVYIKMTLQGKIIYIDPTLERMAGAGNDIIFQAFDSEGAFNDHVRSVRHVVPFDLSHPRISRRGVFKDLSPEEARAVHGLLLQRLNSEMGWLMLREPFVINDKERIFEAYKNIQGVFDVYRAFIVLGGLVEPPPAVLSQAPLLSAEEMFADTSPLIRPVKVYNGILVVKMGQGGEVALRIRNVRLARSQKKFLTHIIGGELGANETAWFEKKDVVSLQFEADPENRMKALLTKWPGAFKALAKKLPAKFSGDAAQKPLTEEAIKALNARWNEIMETFSRVSAGHDIENINQVRKALDLLFHKQLEQRRGDGVSYVAHPMQVALDLMNDLGRTDVDLVVAALLHDVVEDTDVSIHRVRKIFGYKAAWIILALTNLDLGYANREGLSEEDQQFEKIKAYQEHVFDAVEDDDVFYIKLADVATNAFHLENFSDTPARQEWFANKYLKLVIEFEKRARAMGLIKKADQYAAARPGIEAVAMRSPLYERLQRYYDSKEGPDAAQIDSTGFNKGGIDLSGMDLQLQIRRDGNGVLLPMSEQDIRRIRIDGLMPVILDIYPATSMPALR